MCMGIGMIEGYLTSITTKRRCDMDEERVGRDLLGKQT